MREKEKVEMRMILLLIVVNKLTNEGGHSLTLQTYSISIYNTHVHTQHGEKCNDLILAKDTATRYAQRYLLHN